MLNIAKKYPHYNFSPEKNYQLIKERDISFEEIIAAIDDDQILDVVDHPNQGKYSNQAVYVIKVREYVYLVPFVIENDDSVFLKTIIPSRKAKKQYLSEE